jgi:hypothetical protein
MALERLKNCESVTALSEELGIHHTAPISPFLLTTAQVDGLVIRIGELGTDQPCPVVEPFANDLGTEAICCRL